MDKKCLKLEKNYGISSDGEGVSLGKADFAPSESWQDVVIPLSVKAGVSELRLTFSGELSDMLEISFG